MRQSPTIDPQSAIADRQRLEAVLQTGLLDTPPEESFDRLTRLAAKLIGVPSTFISLVDRTRDFYKSCFGFGEPLATTRQLEGGTFCHHAIVSSGPLVIDDTMADPVFREIPTVQSLGVRAYAGIPLITDGGQAIGSFCAIDFAPRAWSALDIEILSELAASAMREIKLRSAVRAAQDAVRAREEVLAVVAHDLRTPLNFIKMGAQLVAEGFDAIENGQVLERMQGAVDLMNLLIEDLLEVAKIEAGKMSINPKAMSAQTLVNDAIQMSQPLAQRHQMRLIAECEPGLPPVLADYERILRVFSNLIVNAVKFTGASGDVRVAAAGGDGTVRFSVIDSGPGISPENLERIFDRFWQADSADRRGAGLGLAIVKAIVTAHGGTIGVNSTVGVGSNFYFDLPVAPALLGTRAE
ncbi:MAG: GAF domain-containing sensor histidine kinase [Verrucomicrobiota bacterium]|nr:GAF domain-containing sensor histidine kinase [Verrucomicrobiota bacterium]